MTAPALSWFNDARFGIFIHWGLYSVHGRDVWAMYNEQTPVEEYRALADRFDPHLFDADEWASMAKAAGARYMVMCTRQHDGYSLFDSAASDFTSVQSGPRRDFVAEFAEAARRAGLGVGFYYSLLDWRYPAYFRGPEGDPAGWEEFVGYVHAQVRELCTQYGEVDILWYDGEWPHGPEAWRSDELNAMVRELQPQILINDRSGVPGDFDTPEQVIPASAPSRAWETCMTMNDHWGYCPGDLEWKSPAQLIANLVSCAANGGNYLLNVGPDGSGAFPPAAVRLLRELGRWLEANGEAIYGTERAAEIPFLIGKHVHWNVGMVHTHPTVRGNTLYTHVTKWPGKELTIGNLACRVLSARLLASGEPVTFRQTGSRVFLSELPQYAPDPHDTVIALECDERPASIARYG